VAYIPPMGETCRRSWIGPACLRMGSLTSELPVAGPTRMVGQKLGVADGGHALTPHRVALVLNGEQGNSGVTKNWQVTLTELCEGLVGSPL
jgi:hypothetical protein